MSGEVFTCGERKPIPVTARGKHLVVDIHCHLGIPAADAIVQAKYPGPPPGINDFTSARTSEVNRAQFAQMGRTLNTLDIKKSGGGATISCKVSMLLADFPDKSVFGFLNGGASVTASSSGIAISARPLNTTH